MGRTIHDAKVRGCFFNADEVKAFENVLLEVKKKLNELEDFLNGNSILFKSSRWKVCWVVFVVYLLSFSNLLPSLFWLCKYAIFMFRFYLLLHCFVFNCSTLRCSSVNTSGNLL